jgi:haloacetate dehalogenase
LLDIVPTRTLYESLDQMRATTVWRYLFLIQPQDLPERLLDANKDLYLDWTFAEWSADSDSLASEAVTEYIGVVTMSSRFMPAARTTGQEHPSI